MARFDNRMNSRKFMNDVFLTR